MRWGIRKTRLDCQINMVIRQRDWVRLIIYLEVFNTRDENQSMAILVDTPDIFGKASVEHDDLEEEDRP